MRDQQRSNQNNRVTTPRANRDDFAACPPFAVARSSRAHPLLFS